MRHRDSENERDDIIISLFRVELRKSENRSISSIMESIALMPAPKLYTSKVQIAEIIYSIRQKSQPTTLSAKYQYIYNRYIEAKEIAPNASVSSISEVIELMPAPSFFISTERIKYIIYRSLSERDKRDNSRK